MKIERYGFVQAMQGVADDRWEAWINTQEDRIIKFVCTDQQRKDFYCTYVKVTIEQISEDELPKLN